MGYTKGPWRVVDSVTPGVLYIDGPSQKLTIITSAIDLDFADYVKRTADAHLIAAAPDLLEALEAIMFGIGYEGEDGWYSEPIHRDEVTAARAAIARAKGESE